MALPPKQKHKRVPPYNINCKNLAHYLDVLGIYTCTYSFRKQGCFGIPPPPCPLKMYQIWGCCTIDLQWYLGGNKLAISKQSKNVASVAHDSTKQVRVQRLLEVPTPVTPGGMPPASLGKSNSPILDWLDWSLARSNTVGHARKRKPTGNSKLCFKSFPGPSTTSLLCVNMRDDGLYSSPQAKDSTHLQFDDEDITFDNPYKP